MQEEMQAVWIELELDLAAGLDWCRCDETSMEIGIGSVGTDQWSTGYWRDVSPNRSRLIIAPIVMTGLDEGICPSSWRRQERTEGARLCTAC